MSSLFNRNHLISGSVNNTKVNTLSLKKHINNDLGNVYQSTSVSLTLLLENTTFEKCDRALFSDIFLEKCSGWAKSAKVACLAKQTKIQVQAKIYFDKRDLLVCIHDNEAALIIFRTTFLQTERSTKTTYQSVPKIRSPIRNPMRLFGNKCPFCTFWGLIRQSFVWHSGKSGYGRVFSTPFVDSFIHGAFSRENSITSWDLKKTVLFLTGQIMNEK